MSTKRNTAYNLGGAIAPAALMLISVPLYLNLVGEARYGVLAIIWLLTGYFGFFDFGLGRATAFALSSKTDASPEDRSRIFWTALIVNLGFGALGGLVILVAAPLLFLGVFNIPEDLTSELAPVLPWLALAVPMLTLEGVLTGALTGREKFLTLNMRAILGSAITQLVPLVIIWQLAPTLTVAIPATLAARAINVSIFVIVAFRAVPATLRPGWGGMKMTRELTGYGGWISLSALLGPLLTALDRFLIATFMTPVAVALYSVPYQLVTRGGLFSRALANALFPRLARLDQAEARTLTGKAMRANAALMLVLCSAGMILMKPFLTLWIGSDFSGDASRTGEQLVITVWLTAVGVILRNAIEADGRPQEIVKILVYQAIPYIVLGALGVFYVGIVGVAIARNFRSLINLLLLARSADFLTETLKLIIAPITLLLMMIFVLNTELVGLELRLAGAGLIWLIGLFLANRLFPEGRAMVIGMIRERFS